MKSALSGIAALLALFITFPIWYYLLYKILDAVNATDLMWFLYIVYVPASFLISAIAQLVKSMED